MADLLLLACGPWFHPHGLVMSLAIFLVLKPAAYFAFIQAFRYRVSRPIPMTFRQAGKLTALRAGLGVLVVGVGALYFQSLGNGAYWSYSWVFLYLERLLVWGAIGWWGAGLRGRRLVGWTISGTCVNAAFDLAVFAGLLSGALVPGLILLVIAAFIAALHYAGRRDALKLRFTTDPLCANCQYNLTGNLSGRCPECGTPIDPATAPNLEQQ